MKSPKGILIWGYVPRIGDIDSTRELYRSELERDKIMVFDLTKLGAAGNNAHDSSFEEITLVMGMIRQRFGQGQAMSDRGPNSYRIEDRSRFLN
jgi:esterase/lipase superfamily enzyme